MYKYYYDSENLTTIYICLFMVFITSLLPVNTYFGSIICDILNFQPDLRLTVFSMGLLSDVVVVIYIIEIIIVYFIYKIVLYISQKKTRLV